MVVLSWCRLSTLLLAICICGKAQDSLLALKGFNWTCALPVEEETPLNDTLAGRWMAAAVMKTIEGITQNPHRLAISACEGQPSSRICQNGVKRALGMLVNQVCSVMSPSDMYGSCNHTLPGYFCVAERDPTTGRTCIMRDSNNVGISVACPPGFYCRGQAHQPRACPKGYFCPARATHPGPCPDGMFCPVASMNISCGGKAFFRGSMCMPEENRTIVPKTCPAGNYCQDGKNYTCPEGHFCPRGVAKGIECGFLEVCPRGSASPGRSLIVLLFGSVFCLIIFLLMNLLNCWCLSEGCEYSFIRVLLVLAILASIWVCAFFTPKSKTQVVILAFFFTAAVVGLLWGAFVTPCLKDYLFCRCINAKILCGKLDAPFLVDGFFFACCALAAGWICEDPATTVFLLSCELGAFGSWWMMADEHDTNSRNSLIDLSFGLCDRADANTVTFLLLFFIILFCLIRQLCSVNLAYLYVATLLLIFAEALYSQCLQEKLLQICFSCCPSSTAKRESTAEREVAIPVPPATFEMRVDLLGDLLGQHERQGENGQASLGSTEVKASVDGRLPLSDSEHTGISIRFGNEKPGPGTDETDVSFAVGPVSSEQKLLCGINVNIPAGTSVALMGPSGCGKSTFIKALSGRASYGRLTGKVYINGCENSKIEDQQKFIGFVPQDDVMHRSLTVREVLRFQTSLRMPCKPGESFRNRTEREEQKVKDTIAMLDLTGTEDTVIGDENTTGISGGQRKRVSIGMELVAEPKLLLLDEPTSGLDSTTAHSVMMLVTEYAKTANCTTLAVIHQPPYKTFKLFDRVIFLGVSETSKQPKHGYLVYSGETGDPCKNYFREVIKTNIEPDENPADCFLDAIVRVREKGSDLAHEWRDYSKKIAAGATQPSPSKPPVPPVRISWGREVFLQMQRTMLQTRKSWMAVISNNFLLVIGLICCWLGAPATRPVDDFMQPSFALFLLSLTQGVAAQRIFGGAEKVVCWREYGASVNQILYFIGRDFTAFLEMFVGAAIFCLAYWPACPLQVNLSATFSIVFSLTFTIWGMNYVWSILFDGNGAQMMAVVCSFASYLLLGLQPSFVELARYKIGMYLMALSPLRWAYGMLMHEHLLGGTTAFSNELVQYSSKELLFTLGYPLQWIHEYELKNKSSVFAGFDLQDLWVGELHPGLCDGGDLMQRCYRRPPISFVRSSKQLLLLGCYFRIGAVLFLLVTAKQHHSGGGKFLQTRCKCVGRFSRNLCKLMCVILTSFIMFVLLHTKP